jgi:hypothetical protein
VLATGKNLVERNLTGRDFLDPASALIEGYSQ